MELSKETSFQNQLQESYFDSSATEIYIDYRIFVDRKLKYLLIEWSKVCEQLNKNSDEDKRLLEAYHMFWEKVEPSMRKFHEELQTIFRVPLEAVFPEIAKSHKVYTDKDIATLQNQIQQLEEELMRSKCYLNHLKVLNNMIKVDVLPLKCEANAITDFLKQLDANQSQVERLEQEVGKNYDNFLKNLSMYDCLKSRVKDVMKEDKVEDVTEEFRRFRMVKNNEE